MCLKELMSTKPIVHGSLLFVVIGTFFYMNFRFEVCNGHHDLMQKLWVLMMLQLLRLKKIIIEFSFGIWVKMKYMSFLWKTMNYLKNIIKFGIKSVIVLQKGFDSEPIYDEKYLETKVNLMNEKYPFFIDDSGAELHAD